MAALSLGEVTNYASVLNQFNLDFFKIDVATTIMAIEEENENLKQEIEQLKKQNSRNV